MRIEKFVAEKSAGTVDMGEKSIPNLEELKQYVQPERTLEEIIDNLDLDIGAETKALLSQLYETTIQIGEIPFPLGRAILGAALELSELFPDLTFTHIVVALLHSLLATWVVWVLGSSITAILSALALYSDYKHNIKNDRFNEAMQNIVAKFSSESDLKKMSDNSEKINPEVLKEVDKVLDNPLAFKKELKIGDSAYKWFTHIMDTLTSADTIATGAAGVAASGLFATKVGLLAFMGIGTSVTPFPYLAAGGIGLLIFTQLIRKKLAKLYGDRVDVIPKFINTPLDLLAVSLFSYIAPILLKIASADGKIRAEEEALIFDYFHKDWGYSPNFLKVSLKIIKAQIDTVELQDLCEPFIDFAKKNPDCNETAINKDLLKIITEIVEADGKITKEEERLIEEIQKYLAPPSYPPILKNTGQILGLVKQTLDPLMLGLDNETDDLLQLLDEVATIAGEHTTKKGKQYIKEARKYLTSLSSSRKRVQPYKWIKKNKWIKKISGSKK